MTGFPRVATPLRGQSAWLLSASVRHAMLSSMTASSRLMIAEAERRFPVRVRVAVPTLPVSIA
jgi:hypothetical protein